MAVGLIATTTISWQQANCHTTCFMEVDHVATHRGFVVLGYIATHKILWQ
jgi:hypothetical protein